MLARQRYHRGKLGEQRGSGSADPDAPPLDEDHELEPEPELELDDGELELSWGRAIMPDFSDEPATSLPVAMPDNAEVYAAASAVDSTDATVISQGPKTARKDLYELNEVDDSVRDFQYERGDKAARGEDDDTDFSASQFATPRDSSAAGEDDTEGTKRPSWIPIVLIVAIIGLVGAAWFVVANYTTLFEGRVAAEVNGETISIADLDERVAAVVAQNPVMFDVNAGGISQGEARQMILSTMIDDLLFMQEAQREGVTVGDMAFQAEVDARIATYPSEEDFEEDLAAAGFTRSLFEQQLRYSMILDALLAHVVPADTVSDAEVRDYYDQNPDHYTVPAAKRSSHILIPLDDRARAVDLRAELADSADLATDFAEAAQESSADTFTAAQGGDAGWPSNPDTRHEDYIAAVDELDVGQMSDLVRTEEGYYIILVTEEREETTRTFEEVEPAIREMMLSTLRNQAQQDLLERLRAEAEVEVLDAEVNAFVDGNVAAQ